MKKGSRALQSKNKSRGGANNMSKKLSKRDNSLADLAVRIREEHAATATALKHGIDHAMNAGDLLIEAKALLKHGQWLPWLDKHCLMSQRTAQLYMRLAKARPEVEAQKRNVAYLPVREAVALLAAPAAKTEDVEPSSNKQAKMQVLDATPDEPKSADEWEAEVMAEGVRLADNMRRANANFVNVFADKCRELREFAERLEQNEQQFTEAELRKIRQAGGFKPRQLECLRARSDLEARKQAWGLLEELGCAC
jgi:hypothetical protein